MVNRFLKQAAYALQRVLPRRHGALILGYHSVGDFDEPYTVSAAEFDWQVAEILRQGLRVISLKELEDMIQTGHVGDGTVVLTFDDGRDDNYTELLPILKKHNVPATVFSITGYIGKTRPSSVRPNPMLSQAQMHEMQSSGLIDFQPHTVTHPKLTQIPMGQVLDEARTSREYLENMFSKPCPYFAYPYGRFTPEIQQWLQKAGINMAVTGKRGFVTEKSDPLALPRSEVKRSTSRNVFKSILRRGSLR